MDDIDKFDKADKVKAILLINQAKGRNLQFSRYIFTLCWEWAFRCDDRFQEKDHTTNRFCKYCLPFSEKSKTDYALLLNAIGLS